MFCIKYGTFLKMTKKQKQKKNNVKTKRKKWLKQKQFFLVAQIFQVVHSKKSNYWTYKLFQIFFKNKFVEILVFF